MWTSISRKSLDLESYGGSGVKDNKIGATAKLPVVKVCESCQSLLLVCYLFVPLWSEPFFMEALGPTTKLHRWSGLR